MKNTITKKNVVHTEGDTNTRKCTCAHCGRILEKGKGFKVVANGTYKFIHEDERDAFLIDTHQKNYKHGITWNVTVYTKQNAIDSLSLLGWATEKTMAVKQCKSLNTFKALKNLKKLNVKIEISTKGGTVGHYNCTCVSYDSLRKGIIKATKKTIATERYGKEIALKMKFNDTPDFINCN